MFLMFHEIPQFQEKWTNAKKDKTIIDDSLSRLDNEMMITSYLQIREIVYSNMNFKHNARKGM